MEQMTKKEFKERSSIHVYGTGSKRRVCLFYDWKQGTIKNKFFIGYKYMVKGYGVTKAQIFKDSYDLLINLITTGLCLYDLKIADTDLERFKVPIVG